MMKSKEPKIILSASRRTDIPAFYGEWMRNRLRDGTVQIRNPFRTDRIRELRLSPDTVDAIVFWTKNPRPLMKFLPEIERMGYRYGFQFTLNAYDARLERNLPSEAERIRTFRELSSRIGREKIIWRYDPILFTPEIGVPEQLRSFRRLAEALAPYTALCIISYLDFYRKTKKNTAQIPCREPEEEEIAQSAAGIVGTAREFGLELQSCCEALELYGIRSGGCLHREFLEGIAGRELPAAKAKSQRAECRCAASVDIGAYETCANGCLYCYANASHENRDQVLREHDPDSPLLNGHSIPGAGEAG